VNSAKPKESEMIKPKQLLMLWITSLLISLPALSNAGEENTTQFQRSLNLAAADWCPYTCSTPNKPGFITEALIQLLKINNIALKVTVLPWSRAIRMARQGSYDGLLTAIVSEAPHFQFTKRPSGHYQICFYTHRSSTFEYSDRSSLSGIKLGGIRDYGYGEPIDSILKEPRGDEHVYLISNSAPLSSLVGMTELKRMDTFVEDSMVVAEYLTNNPNANIKKAGCLESIPFYTALSPKLQHKSALLQELDKLLQSPMHLLLVQEARARYGLIEKH